MPLSWERRGLTEGDGFRAESGTFVCSVWQRTKNNHLPRTGGLWCLSIAVATETSYESLFFEAGYQDADKAKTMAETYVQDLI